MSLGFGLGGGTLDVTPKQREGQVMSNSGASSAQPRKQPH